MRHKILLALALSLGAASGASAQFTSGNLAVSRVGNGTQTLINTGNSVFIDQFTRTGTFVNSLALPDSGPGAIISSGAATSEGQLARSADGRFLTYVGYGTSVGGAIALAGSSSATIPRVIARIDSSGAVDTSTRLSDAFTSNNPRAAVSADGSSFYVAGANDGTRYATIGATTSTIVSSTVTNERAINIFDGNVFFSSGSGTTARGIYQITGLPTTTGNNATQLAATGATSSPYDFFLSSDALTLYVTDDSSLQMGGGLQKYTRASSSGAFSLAYTLTGGLTAGLRSLTVDLNAVGGPAIYAVTADATNATNGNKIVAVQDTGAGAIFATLATAAGNTAFRGVDFAPTVGGAELPEPGTLALLGTGLTGLGGLAVRRRKRSH